jgi:hypothetical protein
MAIVLVFILISAYLFFRRMWFNRRKIKLIAAIERIQICTIEPNIILPEVEVKFKYYFGGGVYFGTGYLLMSDFLEGGEYRIFYNDHGIAVLNSDSKMILSEEHIESYLLSFHQFVSVWVDPVEPFHSELQELYNNSFTVKQK